MFGLASPHLAHGEVAELHFEDVKSFESFVQKIGFLLPLPRMISCFHLTSFILGLFCLKHFVQ